MNNITKYLAKGRKLGKTLEHYKMLEDIRNLVETDFCEDMQSIQRKYTQKEADKMSDIIGKVYLIAHCLTCFSCQVKYLEKKKR